MLPIVIVLISLAGVNYAADDWSHHDEAAWPGQCGVGSEQSPIDIVPHQTLADPHGAHIRGRLEYRGYGNVQVTAENTGYKVMWERVAGQPAPILSGGPLRSNYSFAEVHFHWLSEHSVNGIKYPMEIHLVHTKYGLTLNEATQQRDGVAVIGVLVEVTSNGQGGAVLNELLPAMSYVLTKSERSDQPKTVFNIDLTRLFSPDPQAFYTYHGSLTTPTCPEVVTWIVMEKPVIVSHAHYKNLTRADMDGINNDRAVQPLGQRLVYRSNTVSAACSHLASPTLLGSLAALVSCLGSKVSSTLLGSLSKLLDAKKKLLAKVSKQCD